MLLEKEAVSAKLQKEIDELENEGEIIVTPADVVEKLKSVKSSNSLDDYFDEEKGDGHEDVCYICGEEGDLIMCDGCPR